MAKGSFNGVIKGKKGDTIFYKVTNSNNKEKQGLRQYVPVVKNPKTDGQKYQRAIAATVMRAYAAGKEIFDHSFQGIQPGGKNMNHFRKVNMDALRALIANEISAGTAAADSQARVVAPGIVAPVPNKYIISSGSYNQNLFDFAEGYDLPAATSGETVAAYADRNGLITDDIYTLVVFAVNTERALYDAAPSVNTPYAKQFRCDFFFARLTVKAGLADVTDAVSTYGQLFNIETSGYIPGLTDTTSIAATLDLATLFSGKYQGASIGMIRSRDNEDLRSNSTMEFISEANFGIATPYLLSAWTRQLNALSQSELILEGGNF